MKKHGHNLKKTLLYKNPDIHEISGFLLMNLGTMAVNRLGWQYFCFMHSIL